MTDDDVLVLGECASTLLASPQFNALNMLFEQQVATDLLSTKEDQNVERERLYARLTGSRQFLSFIQLFADRHAELTTKPEASDTAPDIEDDPSVHDF